MQESVNSDFLLNMFELYKETNAKIIENLNDDLIVKF
jgi:hypothetical protein